MQLEDLNRLRARNKKYKKIIWEHYSTFKAHLLQMETDNRQLETAIFEEKQRRTDIVHEYTKKISILESQLRQIRSIYSHPKPRRAVDISKYKLDELDEEGKFIMDEAEAVFEKHRRARELLKPKAEEAKEAPTKEQPVDPIQSESDGRLFDLLDHVIPSTDDQRDEEVIEEPVNDHNSVIVSEDSMEEEQSEDTTPEIPALPQIASSPEPSAKQSTANTSYCSLITETEDDQYQTSAAEKAPSIAPSEEDEDEDSCDEQRRIVLNALQKTTEISSEHPKESSYGYEDLVDVVEEEEYPLEPEVDQAKEVEESGKESNAEIERYDYSNAETGKDYENGNAETGGTNYSNVYTDNSVRSTDVSGGTNYSNAYTDNSVRDTDVSGAVKYSNVEEDDYSYSEEEEEEEEDFYDTVRDESDSASFETHDVVMSAYDEDVISEDDIPTKSAVSIQKSAMAPSSSLTLGSIHSAMRQEDPGLFSESGSARITNKYNEEISYSGGIDFTTESQGTSSNAAPRLRLTDEYESDDSLGISDGMSISDE